MIFDAIFYFAAIVMFVLAAIGRPVVPVSLGWLGLAFFAVPFFAHAAGWV